MKKLVVFLILIMIFALPVAANESVYGEQIEASGADELSDALPDETRRLMENFGIGGVEDISEGLFTPQNIFENIFQFLKDGAKAPAKTGITALVLIIIFGAFSGFKREGEVFYTAELVLTVAIALSVIVPLFGVIQTVSEALKGASVFLFSFIPVFAVIITATGAVSTGSVAMATLMFAAQCVSAFASFGVVPLSSAYLSLSCCSAVSGQNVAGEIGQTVKKAAMWILSLMLTIFSGVLALQTTLAGAGDTLAIRTGKFVIGTLVPVVGGALSEALSTLCGSAELLKGSVAVYGIVALCLTALPVVVELILYRFWVFVCSFAAGVFSQQKTRTVLTAIDGVLSILVNILLLTSVTFVICLIIVTKAVGGK